TSSLNTIRLHKDYKKIVDTLGFSATQLENIEYTNETPSPSPTEDGNNTGVIVGSIIGVIAAIALGAGGFIYWKKMQAKKGTTGSSKE
ncbi:MAG: hypothetical protein ACRCXE_01505, partial [Metamycoplasmataceae bacterium]